LKIEWWYVAFAWIIYGTMHSLLASTRLKNYFKKNTPRFYPYYRIAYNLFAIVLLIPVFYLQTRVSYNPPIFNTHLSLTIIGIAGIMWSLYLGKIGFKAYRSDEFFGTYQAKYKSDFHPSSLQRKGMNNVVRHPLYFAGLVGMWSYLLVHPLLSTLVSVSAISLYIFFGTYFEERKLKQEFGVEYERYQNEVSRLIPIKWLKAKLNG
jgi:protein-S-isoprenylcysteine O-methyltransferase Ste14